MNATIKLGRIWGIPIGLHPSWFLIFFLLTWSLVGTYFPAEYPQLSGSMHLLLGLVTSLLFFGSVLAHELGHAFIALRNKIPVRGITLFVFGGVAQIEQEPKSPGAEFRIAIAGPLVSLGLSLFFEVLFLLDRTIPVLAAPSVYLARINLMLALFNLIPGFPLDGGRVLRAIIWKYTGRFDQATRVAASIGQIVAFGFVGFGVYSAFTGGLANGLWLAFIGWFLHNAAAGASAQLTLVNRLSGMRVDQVMRRDLMRISGLTPLSTLVEESILVGGQRMFLVTDNGNLNGMLTLGDITGIPRGRWGLTTSRQAMTPLERMARVTPDTDLAAALQIMDKAATDRLAVVQDAEVVGILTREQVAQALRLRADLGL